MAASTRARAGLNITTGVAVLVVIITIVALAIRADGRTETRSTSNDGGAWLLNRDAGVIGHVNRAVGEITGVARVSTPRADFDVEQALDLIVVHDRSASEIHIVDDVTHLTRATTQVPVGSRLLVAGTDVVVHSREPFSVWRVDATTFSTLERVDTELPFLEATETEHARGALVETSTDGRLAVFQPALGRLTVLGPDGGIEVTEGLAFDATHIALIGNATVLAGDRVHRVEGNRVTTLDTPTAATSVQQSSSHEGTVVAVADGRVVSIDFTTGALTELMTLHGTSPLRPLVHGGCTHVVTTSPARYQSSCGADHELVGAGDELRLRLVNGWVWINDVRSGATWLAGEEQRLDRIDDWGAALSDNDGDTDGTAEDGGGIEQRRESPDNADADLVKADEIDEDGENDDPVASDDMAAARVDQPVVISVLDNDLDPDGDILAIDSVGDLSHPGTSVVITPRRDQVQVIGPLGFSGTLTFSYTISDGRGAFDTARVAVEVSAMNVDHNRAPTLLPDLVSTRAGTTATVNVLDNDSDPDGDSLVLESVEAEHGTVSFDPSGQVSYTPDLGASEGTIVLTYVASDDFGATATGTIRVAVRLPDSNNDPDARNDVAVATVGRPLVLDILANDTDPDGDALIVNQVPELQSPEGAIVDVRISPDGEFVLLSDSPGTHIFRYVVSDGAATDVAQIRVEVAESEANRPPVAVRDDITVPAGASRVVDVLSNDGDPDGDVIGIAEWVPVEGLVIEELPGIGFRITVDPSAPSRLRFTYAISDGLSDPVATQVVVAVSGLAQADQPPLARADIIEVRPGQTTTIPVLNNDLDPEGGTLRLVGPAALLGQGDLRLAPDGQTLELTVDPDVRFGFSFPYDVADEAGNRAGAVVEVRIVPPGQPNRPPIARPDSVTMRVDQLIRITVVDNDSDPDGDAVRVQSLAVQPMNGRATVTAEGTIEFEPHNGFTGTERLQYVLIDAQGATALGEVLIGVFPPSRVNRPPVAIDDTSFLPIEVDTPAVELNVLANDADPDGDPINVTSTSGVSLGTVRRGADGDRVVYTPPAELPVGAAQVDVSFGYEIDDGNGQTDSATVTLMLVARTEPQPPVAANDTAGPWREGQTGEINVLLNDVDPDAPTSDLVVTSTDPAVTVVGNQLRLTAGPATSQHRYRVTDTDGLSADAVVTLVVVENQAPVTITETIETPYQTPITVDLHTLVTDGDGDPLLISCCDSVTGGSARVVKGPATDLLTIEFVPDPAFEGSATIIYRVDDEHGHIVAGAVTITVLPRQNRAPTAADTTRTVEGGNSITVNLADLVDDPDLDGGDELTYGSSAPDTGAVTLARAGGIVTVSAALNSTGADGFSYTVTDQGGLRAAGQVDVNVVAPNDPAPEARADQARTLQGVAVDIPLTANDIFHLGTGLTVTSVGVSTDGTVTLLPDGQTARFVPDNTFFGTASFSYGVEDGRRNRAYADAGVVTIDVVGRPDLPAAPAAVADTRSATVTWVTPPSNGAPIDDYIIEHDQGGSLQLGDASSSHRWDALTNGTTYRFRIQARNKAGWGEFSDWSQPVIPDIEPGRPATPTLQFDDGALVVTWTKPPNEGTAITNYTLEIGGGASTSLQLSAVTSHRWTGLTNGTEYQFRVTATNTEGDSAPSAWSASEHPLGAPAAPAQPTAARGDRLVDMTWSAPDNNGDPISTYEIQREGTTIWVPVPPQGASTTYRWSDLVNGQPARFRVRASNRTAAPGPASAWSDPIVPCAAPDTPGAPTASRGDSQVTLSWAAPSDQGCSILRYEVSNGATTQSVTGGTSHIFTGLTNGASYTFTVAAVNEVDTSLSSPPSAVVTPAGPPLAVALNPAGQTSPGVVDLTWAAPGSNGDPIARYEVQVNGGGWVPVGSGTSTSLTGLQNASVYTFRIRAVNSVDAGAASNSVGLTTWGAPGQVAAPTVVAGNGLIDVSWTAPPANGSPIIGYRVAVSPGAPTDLGPGLGYRFNGLANGTTYSVTVQAFNAVGGGAVSAAGSGTPQAPPPAVSVNRGASAIGVITGGGTPCSHPSCAWVDVTVNNMPANSTLGGTCDSSTGVPSAFKFFTITTDGNGNGSASPCFFGFPGEQLWVHMNGTRSNTIPW
ncbi:MAG: tandem-95 repeat protein [Actinomycetia bacterium]|nr:tandem-95 repeat protein [Actinomycetes bacterium]